MDARKVYFADGSSEEVDVIVWCTGYNVEFPFFDRDFISAPYTTLDDQGYGGSL